MPYQGVLCKVTDRDEMIGGVDFRYAHQKGILHRGVRVVGMDHARAPSHIFLTQRAHGHGGNGLWQLTAQDHVPADLPSYDDAAKKVFVEHLLVRKGKPFSLIP